MMLRLVGLLLTIGLAFGWPDGAPCLPRVLNTMDPSESQAHFGGEQSLINGTTPFQLVSEYSCYWPNSDLKIRLESTNDKVEFRGFALQAFNGATGIREGEFAKDSSGAWKYQCLFEKAAITHSLNTQKKRVEVKWKTLHTNHYDPIYFTATVVENRKKFWVKSVRLGPIPHCEIKNVRKSECFDWSANCWGWSRNCRGTLESEFVRKNCQRTCNICTLDDVLDPTTTKTTESTGSKKSTITPELPLKVAVTTRLPPLRSFPAQSTTLTPNIDDIQTFVAGDDAICTDSDSRCKKWSPSFCNESVYVMRHCKLACGLCHATESTLVTGVNLDETKPFAQQKNSNDAIFGPSSSALCFDKDPNCRDWKFSLERCSFDVYLIRNCQWTCGLCGQGAEFLLQALNHVATITEKTECRDNVPSPFCGEFWDKERCFYDSFVIKNCRKTCKLC